MRRMTRHTWRRGWLRARERRRGSLVPLSSSWWYHSSSRWTASSRSVSSSCSSRASSAPLLHQSTSDAFFSPDWVQIMNSFDGVVWLSTCIRFWQLPSVLLEFNWY
ncbi:hypothetical protein P3X46_006341 [Hevea brasiliensis]|uniref:Uncharacterized protein n=1 Tax=Hevea brasiliensis TaxID=3981 RepID=A0ABQ9MSB0_HEVBR|nr:hypothetical protein P3X46_006341 [Hevea brasiliensis]